MDLGLKGKVALVAASSDGLGFAAARELVREGARVVLSGRDKERLAAAVGRLTQEFGPDIEIRAQEVDVSDQKRVVSLVDFTIDQFGQLDILITNAGGPPGGSFDSTDLAAWRKGIDLTLMSTVYLVKVALPHLRRSEAASILTVTSISVKEPIPNLLLSNVVRPAVVGLTKSLSQELAADGIRANSILPGWTKTGRVDYLMNLRAETNKSSIEEEIGKITRSIPMGRMGDPAEFGRVAAFLVSPAASYVTGVMMQVDGGSYSGLL